MRWLSSLQKTKQIIKAISNMGDTPMQYNADNSLRYEWVLSRCHHVLKRMDAHSNKAVTAIMMLIGHESLGGKYWVQMGGGPAMGIIQMEDWVHEDTWEHCDSIERRAKLAGIDKNINLLLKSVDYNIFMARCRLLMDVNPIPEDLTELSVYLKQYWNTPAGKATPEEYYNDWERWKNAV